VSLGRTFKIIGKDVRMSPRQGIFFFAIAMPVILTVLIQLVFGSLFDPKPRLGVVDRGESEITETVLEMEELDARTVASEEELLEQLEAHDLDAGIVLASGFDDAVAAGEKPELGFYLAGESIASDRIIVLVTTIDLVRGVEGGSPPVRIETTRVGDAEVLPIATRLVPSIMIYALIVAGVFVPAFYVVAEREQGTLQAILITPVKFTEFLTAKAVFGFVLSFALALFTLALNGALGGDYPALLISMAVASLMCAEIGLVYATGARDIKTLYTLIKSLNIFIFAPVIFYIFPNWPQWIAKLFPTYWFLNPIFDVTTRGYGLADVWGELLVALAICAAFVPIILVLARRMKQTIGAE
jgi:ABC-2 type transport system permease protein